MTPFVLVGGAILLVVAVVSLVPAYGKVDEDVIGAWAERHSLSLDGANRPLVEWYLRTARILRTWGALAGLILPPLVELAWSGEPRFLGMASGGGAQPGDVVYIFIGYLIGALYAEVSLVRPIDPSRPRSASVVRRDLEDYLPRRLLWSQRAAGAAVVLGTLVAPLIDFGPNVDRPSWPAVVSWAVVVAAFTFGLERLQRWLVRRPQPFTGPSLVAADDAIRSQSVHSLAGSALAVLLLQAGFLLGAMAGSGGPVRAWVLGPLAVAALLLALTACQWGSHRAWRVRHHVNLPPPVSA
jgi:uncharacterized membrane protein